MLKAGRVGVASDEVDEFGHIKNSGGSGDIEVKDEENISFNDSVINFTNISGVYYSYGKLVIVDLDMTASASQSTSSDRYKSFKLASGLPKNKHNRLCNAVVSVDDSSSPSSINFSVDEEGNLLLETRYSVLTNKRTYARIIYLSE